MFIKSILKKIRDKLFLNAVQSLLNETFRKNLSEMNDAIDLKLEESSEKLKAKINELHRRFDEEKNEIHLVTDSQTENLRRKADELHRRFDEAKYDLEVGLRNNRFANGDNISKFVGASIINHETFSQYKDYCKGKNIVICGAGTSLKNYVPLKDAVHIALNRSFLFDKVDFDFIYVQDFDGIKMIQDELENYKPDSCIKMFAWQYSKDSWDWLEPKNTPESLVRRCKGKRFVTDIFYQDDLNTCKFVPDIDTRAIGNFPNVALDCMQFALFMNPQKIYLVGLDHTGNHFMTKNLNEKQITEENNYMEWYWNTVLEPTKEIWHRCKTFAKVYYPDTEIVSVNPVGLKGIFKDWYQSDGGEPE